MPMRSLFLCLFLGLTPGAVIAQSDAARLAGLAEDVALLRQQVNALRLENESLQRDLRALRQEARRNEAETPEAVTAEQVRLQMNALRIELNQAIAQGRTEIVAALNRQVQDLARQTQSSLEALADAIDATPPTISQPAFSDDFPDVGVVYTVRSGDTVSSIASRHGATVADILNANRIADPRSLQAGQKIFVPQRNPGG
jgi:LysM repeat protein